MPSKSGKTVQKSVQKSAQNWWKKNVQKSEKLSFTQYFEKSTKVLQTKVHNNCTKIYLICSLLYLSFTHYSHRTTITTTTYK